MSDGGTIEEAITNGIEAMRRRPIVPTLLVGGLGRAPY